MNIASKSVNCANIDKSSTYPHLHNIIVVNFIRFTFFQRSMFIYKLKSDTSKYALL